MQGECLYQPHLVKLLIAVSPVLVGRRTHGEFSLWNRTKPFHDFPRARVAVLKKLVEFGAKLVNQLIRVSKWLGILGGGLEPTCPEPPDMLARSGPVAIFLAATGHQQPE